MMSLMLIASVLLRNALTRHASTTDKEDRNCQRTNQAFLEQTCGAAAPSK
jgi:hypothetical protein